MTSLPRIMALFPLVLCSCASNLPQNSDPTKVHSAWRPSPHIKPLPAEPVAVKPFYLPCPPTPTCANATDPRWRDIPIGADTAMWTQLDSLAQAEYLSHGGLLGAIAVRLGDTMPLWDRNPDARFLPASTQKVYTAAVAISELGPAFRWCTQLLATGTLHESVLRGNLVLEGGGDPTLGMPEGTSLDGLAAAAARAGIRRVHGNLVALDTLVGRGPDAWPQGWTIGSARDGYGSPVLGLNWNQNRVGDRALLEPRPTALKALRAALLERGILVLGSDTTVKVRGDALGSTRYWTRLGSVYSAELEPVLRVCLKESVNPFAEAMLLGLGMGRRGTPRESGRKRIQEWLSAHGVDPTRMLADDGSGLSRYDLTSARQMALLLSRNARLPGKRLVELLPKGGEGTLRRRFRNLDDPSMVTAKTGTLDGVSNLAGYLVRPGQDTVAFAIMCGGFAGSPRPVRLFQDRMIAVLAGVPLRPVVAADTADTISAKPATDSVHLAPDPKLDSAFARGAVVDSGTTLHIIPTDTTTKPSSVRVPEPLVVPPVAKPPSAFQGHLDSSPVRDKSKTAP